MKTKIDFAKKHNFNNYKLRDLCIKKICGEELETLEELEKQFKIENDKMIHENLPLINEIVRKIHKLKPKVKS